VALAACGKDSAITEAAGPTVEIEFAEGVEIHTPSDTLARYFDNFAATAYQGRPAIALRELLGGVVAQPELYGYRFIGTDGYYANMPGKEYGDNTWSQLGIGYLDLIDIRIAFDTDADPALRKGHNVKWVIRVDVLRAIDIVWPAGRKLAAVDEVDTTLIPEGYPGAGTSGLRLDDVILLGLPDDLPPESYLYRLRAPDGSELPRLLTWTETRETYYLPDEDRVVMAEALGSAYQVAQPRTVLLEGAGR
jgi:hypothetical protein